MEWPLRRLLTDMNVRFWPEVDGGLGEIGDAYRGYGSAVFDLKRTLLTTSCRLGLRLAVIRSWRR